jgi:hypothetical protein
MNFTANEYYQPFCSPSGNYSIVAGDVEEQSMGGAYRASLYLWQKGNPLFELHNRAAGMGVWSADSQQIYFPIWFNDINNYLKQQLACYNITTEKLLLYAEEFKVISLEKLEKNILHATLSPFYKPKPEYININTLDVASETPLLFKKHAAYYNFEHPILNITGTEYKKEPIPQIFVQYCLHCHVPNENAKLFYPKAIKQLYEILNPMIQNWKFKRVFLDTAKFRPISKKLDKDGSVRITGNNAPNGGRKNVFNKVNLEKISSLHISHNPNLINNFEGKSQLNASLYLQHPEGLPHIFSFEIYGRKNTIKTPNWTYECETPMHFYLQCSNCNGKKVDTTNQQINIWMPQSLMPETQMDSFVNQIGKIAFAHSIYRNETAWIGTVIKDLNDYITMSYRANENTGGNISLTNKYGLPWQKI